MITFNIPAKVNILTRYLTDTELNVGQATLLLSAPNSIYIPLMFTINALNSGPVTNAEIINVNTSDSYTGIHNVSGASCKIIPIKDVNVVASDIYFNFASIGAGNLVLVSLIYYTVPVSL